MTGEAVDGRQALELALADPPEIVLTDISMPGMNGIEFTRRLVEAHPHVRVVALTGAEPGEALSDMIRNGAVGYLVKTASIEEMIQALDAVRRGLAVLAPEATSLVLKDLVQHYRAEQQRAEALLALDAMKRDFMNVISHELKTPVTIIKGGVQTLKRGAERLDAEAQRTFLDSIERQCLRLQRMVDQILIVTQIQKAPGRGGALNFPDLLASIVDALPDDDRKRVSLDVGDSCFVPHGDAVGQIIGWILDNSLAFSDGRVRIGSVSRNGDHVTVRIADDGIGMDEELIRRVLTEPFTQNDSSITRERDGLGLSLYAARQVLENLGGRLDIQGSPGQGTTVSLRLPTYAHEASAGEPHAPATGSRHG